jgi:hypothetical protein
MWQAWKRIEMYTGLLFETSKEGGYSEYLDVDVMVILKWVLQKLSGRTWTGFI